MKKALLWLSTLACLALACLYAYAWFTRDPLVVSFERIEIGMKLEKVTELIGRESDVALQDVLWENKMLNGRSVMWMEHSNTYRLLVVFSPDGRVTAKRIRAGEPTIDKAINWACALCKLSGR